MPEEYLPGNSSAGMQLIRNGQPVIPLTTTDTPKFAEFVVDTELDALRDEFRVWLDALGRLSSVLVTEARSPQRDHTVIALRRNITEVSDTLQRLVEAVYERNIE